MAVLWQVLFASAAWKSCRSSRVLAQESSFFYLSLFFLFPPRTIWDEKFQFSSVLLRKKLGDFFLLIDNGENQGFVQKCRKIFVRMQIQLKNLIQRNRTR